MNIFGISMIAKANNFTILKESDHELIALQNHLGIVTKIVAQKFKNQTFLLYLIEKTPEVPFLSISFPLSEEWTDTTDEFLKHLLFFNDKHISNIAEISQELSMAAPFQFIKKVFPSADSTLLRKTIVEFHC